MTMAMTTVICDILMKQQAHETTCLRNNKCDLRLTDPQSHCSKEFWRPRLSVPTYVRFEYTRNQNVPSVYVGALIL